MSYNFRVASWGYRIELKRCNKKIKSSKIGMGVTLAVLASVSVLAYGQSADAAVRHSDRQHSAASAWTYQQFRDSEDSPYPDGITSDGSVTGPIPHSANGG
jgi:hypothetical protein